MPEPAVITVEKFVIDVQAQINRAVVRFSNGVTWSDFGETFEDLKKFAMQQAISLAISGAEKKDYVLQALSLFLDSIAIPVPWYLKPFVPAIKKWFLLAAAGSIESTLKLLKQLQDAKPAV